ncbi:bifunctional diguanylate cyclase/phosphodiesterase [Ammoniphilus sp. YIM 78166]|uniref:putative bifunctional diguanylate cyclase/phosphodiesterase n=1 Tax=Ammoniphilus sp. YIM 78166 TaxID=1644106 RepID=UPI0010701A35|nr:diguanylate cyclase [Ammoniphilus sp. YIM 78166]
MEWFYLFLLIMGSLFTIMMVVFLDRTILARLLTFTQQLSYIRQNHDLSARVSYKGNDEISKLKKEFNRMMSSMEEYQRKLSYQAYHDSLTGLPNRTLFMEKLEQSITHAIQSKEQGALLFLDLDDFKPLNDTFGHDVGDLLLQKVTERLQRCIRSNDVISRLGGDEFTILLPSIQRRGKQKKLVKAILHSLSQPFQLEEYQLCISVSIGLTLFLDDGVDSTILIKNGDLATLQVKERGGNDLQWYTDEINQTWDRKLLVEHQLRHALERNELMLVYQPKMDLQQGRIVGAEALIRWKSPLLGQVSPAGFIPIAEASGQIIEIGEWVLRTACQQWKIWINRGLLPIAISVNLFGLANQTARLRRTNSTDCV